MDAEIEIYHDAGRLVIIKNSLRFQSHSGRGG